MTRRNWISAGVSLMGLGAAGGARGQVPAGSLPDTLTAELRELRLEVIELLTGSLESRADDLERELAQLRDRQRELQNTEETQRTQVHDADQQLAGADIDADTRAQLEGIRVQLTGPGLEELKSSQSAVSARQSQIVDSLERVRQRLSSLRQRERDLTGGGASR